jgi:uncharacterized RDD family membrane protein YckC
MPSNVTPRKREEAMTDASTQNPFAPPRANVADTFADAPPQMIVATRGQRFLAFLVDISPGFVIGIIGVVLALAMMPGLLSGHFDPAVAGFATFGLVFLLIGGGSIAWLIWNIVLLYKYGQTIGKKALGIRVVRMDGSRVSFPRFLFLRWLAIAVIGGIVGGICGALRIPFVGNLVGLVDILFIFGPACRCLHDFIADTQVVTAASSPNATLEGARGY